MDMTENCRIGINCWTAGMNVHWVGLSRVDAMG